MEYLPLPNNISAKEVGPNHAQITIEPCYPGYGFTMGNALRRVLLSSLPGSAVTAIKVIGVDHEFSSLPGVKEDIVDLLLNIKQLRVKVHATDPVKVILKATGEKEVTAADITPNSDVEILNTDLHLATLTDKKASLEIEFTCEQGRGYVTVESRDSKKLDIGTIAIDALFSPIRRVGYSVENVRVGQMTNYEKVTLDVETDGSVTPLESVQQAARVLIEHFNVIIGESSPSESEPVTAEDTEPVEQAETKPAKKRGRPKKDEE